MIDPKEFRPNNWVNSERLEFGNKYSQIGSISIHGDVGLQREGQYSFDGCRCENLDAVELSPEWLERFGFEHIDYRDKWQHWGFFFQLQDPECEKGYWIADGIYIKYVHQLQNLYFALTGQELELKDRFATYTAEQKNEAAKVATDVITELAKNAIQAAKQYSDAMDKKYTLPPSFKDGCKLP